MIRIATFEVTHKLIMIGRLREGNGLATHFIVVGEDGGVENLLFIAAHRPKMG